MNKTTLLFSIILLGFVTARAQAPKFAFLEEFTNDGCGPCAEYNPGFEATVIDQNPTTVRLISYHTPGPGADPMYNAAASQINSRISYYNDQYVPTVFMLGNKKSGSPANFSQADVNSVLATTSPIAITVKDVKNGTDHTVTVQINSIGIPGTGTNYKLRTAIVQRNKTYTSPPGTNGEKYFPNVFLQMLPSATGDPVTLPVQGDSVVFTYTYTENAAWNMPDIGLISFIQDDNTKEVLNCGSNFDVSAAITNTSNLTHAGTPGISSSFTLNGQNNGKENEVYAYTVSSNAPADWSSNLVVNGVTYTNTDTITLAPKSSIPVTITVTPGNSPAFAQYTLTITSVTNPAASPVTSSVYVISGITDLVVNNDAVRGDGEPQNASHWESSFLNGLSYAGCTSYTSIGSGIATAAGKESSLSAVKNIYYNVGWTYPAFTDEWVEQLENFMNSGGNLFISGQDIGNDVTNYDLSAIAQDFYASYMNAKYINDGDASDKPLTANTNDAVFGSLGSTNLINYYVSGTGLNFFPDEIQPIGIGLPIFYYNNDVNKIGGIRADNGIYKMVYVAPGPEMFSSTTNKNNLFKTTYDWFYGITGINDIPTDNVQLGQNYPNPSDQVTYIPVSNLKKDYTLTLSDVAGRILLSQKIARGSSLVEINTSSLPQGMYFYKLDNDANHISPKSLQVIH